MHRSEFVILVIVGHQPKAKPYMRQQQLTSPWGEGLDPSPNLGQLRSELMLLLSGRRDSLLPFPPCSLLLETSCLAQEITA